MAALAQVLDVSPQALDVPDIDTGIGLIHTLFALEDIRGLTIGEIDDEISLRLDRSRGLTYSSMFEMLLKWANEAKKLAARKITREEYDHWRYTYPKVEAQRTRDELDALRKARQAKTE